MKRDNRTVVVRYVPFCVHYCVAAESDWKMEEMKNITNLFKKFHLIYGKIP